MNVVGRDSTPNRLAAAGWASISISTWDTSGTSAHTWSTTRRTEAHGPHQSALKWTTVGPVWDRPRSDVSSEVSRSASRNTPERRLSTAPLAAAVASAAIIAVAAIASVLTRPPYFRCRVGLLDPLRWRSPRRATLRARAAG